MTVVGVDLGKTSARARLVPPEGDPVESRADGCPGLAEHGAAVRVVTRVGDLITDLLGRTGLSRLQRLVLGVPGAEAAPGAAAEVAADLAEMLPGDEVLVVADSVTALAGALHGRPGAVLSAGTGAVALVLDEAGDLSQFDGWGQWLGDDGSGAWIGRAGLRAALLHEERRGGSRVLHAAAGRVFGDVRRAPSAVAVDGNPGGRMAAFAPEVLAAARAGDAESLGILRRAGELLGATLRSAVDVGGVTRAAVVGGLRDVPEVMAPLAQTLGDVTLVDSPGTGLDGAVLMASADDLPHLRRAQRGGRT